MFRAGAFTSSASDRRVLDIVRALFLSCSPPFKMEIVVVFRQYLHMEAVFSKSCC